MMKQSWLFYLSSWFWPQTQVFVLLKKQTWLDAVKHEASLKHRMDSSAKWQTCFCWFASFSEITLLQFGVRAASYQTQCYRNARHIWEREHDDSGPMKQLLHRPPTFSLLLDIFCVVFIFGFFTFQFFFGHVYFVPVSFPVLLSCLCGCCWVLSSLSCYPIVFTRLSFLAGCFFSHLLESLPK